MAGAEKLNSTPASSFQFLGSLIMTGTSSKLSHKLSFRCRQDIQHAREVIDATPDVRENYIAAAKDKLINGTLTREDVELAEKLLKMEIERERHDETSRQGEEIHKQAIKQNDRLFTLRLIMGFSSVILLIAVMIVSSLIIFNNQVYPAHVLTAASAALFVDVVGLLASVWKIVLKPNLV